MGIDPKGEGFTYVELMTYTAITFAVASVVLAGLTTIPPLKRFLRRWYAGTSAGAAISAWSADSHLGNVRTELQSELPRLRNEAGKLGFKNVEDYIGANNGPMNAIAHALANMRSVRLGTQTPQESLAGFQAREIGPTNYGTPGFMDVQNNIIGNRLGQGSKDPVDAVLNTKMWFFTVDGDPPVRLVYDYPRKYLDKHLLDDIKQSFIGISYTAD
ncbi:hypothetical protein [Poriferisphaera sp. WC338]|uniref:hypothetical protein n=1 Tax=Poriferisphaera sp. WC338 TaxID=3425129 RepID=UPI003D817911